MESDRKKDRNREERRPMGIRKLLGSTAVFLMMIGVFLYGQAVRADSKAVDNARSGVVRIFAYDLDDNGYSTSLGSGFGVGEAGKETDVFVTNWHVVTNENNNDEYQYIYILLDNKALKTGDKAEIDDNHMVRCEVLYRTEGYPDLAILKAEESVDRVALPLYPSGEVPTSTDVYALGYPSATDINCYDENGYYVADVDGVTTTKGTIGRFVEADSTKCIQHDAHINHGNSGGPLMTEDGAVIGINTFLWGEDDTYGYSIRIDYAMDALDELGIDYDIYGETNYILWIAAGFALIAAAAVWLAFVLIKKKPVPAAPARPVNPATPSRPVNPAPPVNPSRPVNPAPPVNPSRPYPAAEVLRIQGLRGQYSGKRFPVEKDLHFGVNPANDLTWPAEANGVSRVHCTILLRGSQIYLQDEGSTYGTFLNGQKLPPRQPVPMKKGDTFSLGSDNESFQVTGRGGAL